MSKAVNAPLFDVTNIESVRANPILAKAFVRLVPPYELARVAREADFENSLLDEPAIVDGIIESGNPELALVLATYGASSIFRLTADRLMQLIDISPAHKAAVFANPRINWYSAGLFGNSTSFATKELVEGVQQTEHGEQPSEFARLLAANPRFDRGAIADVIRAQPPYADVPLDRRIFVAFHALGPSEIPSPDYPGKDSPDSNELDFEKPLAAFPTLVRDVYRESGRAGFLAFADQFVWKLRTLRLDVAADDWISPDDGEFSGGDAFLREHRRRASKAYEAVLELLNEVFAGMEPGRSGDQKTTDEERAATFAVLLIRGLERSYWLSESKRLQSTRLTAMLAHPCWVIRAGAFSVLFEATGADDAERGYQQFMAAFPEDDYAKAFGVITSEAYARHANPDPLGNSVHQEGLRKFYGDFLQYVFFNREDEASAARIAEEAKRRSAEHLPVLAAVAKRKPIRDTGWGKAFEVDEPLGDETAPTTSLSGLKRWLGRT